MFILVLSASRYRLKFYLYLFQVAIYLGHSGFSISSFLALGPGSMVSMPIPTE